MSDLTGSRILFFFLAAVVLAVGGCKPDGRGPRLDCAGRADVVEGLEVLRDNAEAILPLKATGKCLWEHYADDGRRQEREQFPVRLWLNPPDGFRLWGDIAFNSRGLDMGLNEEVYWFAVKPEVSSFYWGRWRQSGRGSRLIINPKLVLEAFGIADVESDVGWTMWAKDGFDVLILSDKYGRTVKRVYLNNCDSLVYKIEYLNDKGAVSILTELDSYKEIGQGFFAPSDIKIVTFADGVKENLFSINLKDRSLKRKEFSDKEVMGYFSKPKDRGYQHILENIDGQWIENGN